MALSSASIANNSNNDFYADHEKLYVATDCIVFGFDEGDLKLLIFKRRVEPDSGIWSLIGSFVQLDEDVNDAARRVLKEITGLDEIFLEQSKAYGKTDRDPGYRCLSVAHYALIRIDDYDKELVESHGAYWYTLKDLPKLALDHDQMVADALSKLRRKARHQPIGFELLPEKFTIPQLQQLYEGIYQRELDPRNFRKKVLSLKVLVKLDEKDKSGSKRGAFLYRFDFEKYQELLESGYNFEI
ncbi:NUDIX hydrolase [Leeuwenhoekiella marinoflava]|uniref:ADP-ribose pyrophosphatase YjhB (NUDIX family) n=2 Tax=Leeuwenhoekiella marinoflava TaxID=988 RepID=A0A4V1KS38_9FLAO|nr:NUDIX domain-containing protein [Leeuwenhoekiella marinoflava]RXG27365.1 ADP-ribose pyrophosphatase YjhB (NUDIX family) [Leeuwenhoekiella marinoflava]SHF71293.1 ADP-ribose pyrophosphatase YjhB, NUDIX family [Leeuwenhoekiella marinoflava DSM 3653]